MKLAIASKDLGNLSETFVRDHVEQLSPTALIAQSKPQELFRALPFHRIRPSHLLNRDTLWPFLSRNANPRNKLDNRWSLSKNGTQELTEFLAEHKIDRLLAEFGPNGLLCLDACRKAKVKLATYFHGYDASRLLREPAYRDRLTSLFDYCDVILTPSEHLRGRLISVGAPESSVTVHPYGVDIPLRNPNEVQRREKIVIGVGRLVPKKAPDLLIRAFSVARQAVPDANMVLIGDGPLRRRCERIIEELGLSGAVTMRGSVGHEEVKTLLNHASVFAQHSLTAPDGDEEGLPVAILEAMASGLPVVSTVHSGIPEAVRHGVSGFVVPEGSAALMGQEIAQLLQDEDTACSFGQAGRRWVAAHAERKQQATKLSKILEV